MKLSNNIQVPRPGDICSPWQPPRRVGAIFDHRAGRTLEHDADGEASAGIVGVVHVIPTIHVVNVDVVRVVPAYRPWFNEPKPIATIVEARISADQFWFADAEVVFTAKIGMETLVWNSTAAPGAEPEFRLRALSVLFLLCAPGRSRKSSLLLALLLLSPGLLLLTLLPRGLSLLLLTLLSWSLSLLLLALLSRSLSLLLTFRPRLLLLLRGPSLLLFLLRFILPRVNGSDDSKKHKKRGCINDFDGFHDVFSDKAY